MLNSDLSIYEKLLRSIRERKVQVSEALLTGAIPDFTSFKEQRARLAELQLLEQELKDLLNKVVEND